jgi:hypothetical protein
MRSWVDVFDAAGNRLGDGYLACKFANVTRRIDGAGEFSLVFVAGDARVQALIQSERRVRIYVIGSEAGAVARELGGGIIQRIRVREGRDGRELEASGTARLVDLARSSVLLGRKYANEPIADVVDDLVTGVSGWSVDTTGVSGNVSARFDGMSRLKALITLAEQTGYHLREDTGEVVTFGALGAGVDVRLYGGGSSGAWAQGGAGEVLPVESIVVDESTADVVNTILPLGAGDGDTALTLEHSTRTSPYTVQTTTLPDGRTGYYLSDATSITAYGSIERVVKFQNIAPLSNDDASIERAANALYDAAAAYLDRHKVKQVTYTVQTRRAGETVAPGDKIRLTYKGLVETTDGDTTYVDVNEALWVLSATERVALEGVGLSLELSTVDQIQRDGVETIVGALEEAEIQRTAIQSYPVVRGFVYRRELDSSTDAVVPVLFTDATLSLIRARVRVSTRAFVSTTTAAASGGGVTSAGGGDHSHRVFAITTLSGFPSTSLRPFLGRNSAGGAFHHLRLDTALNQDLWTESSSGNHAHSVPAHTHPLVYGIYTDSQTPDTLRVALNGVDITSALSGPWAVGGGAVTFEIDITAQLLATVGGLRQAHELTFSCDSGRGEVEVSVETFEVVQALVVL